VYAVSFVQFESVTACLSSGIPLKKFIEFKYSETKDNPVTPGYAKILVKIGFSIFPLCTTVRFMKIEYD